MSYLLLPSAVGLQTAEGHDTSKILYEVSENIVGEILRILGILEDAMEFLGILEDSSGFQRILEDSSG